VVEAAQHASAASSRSSGVPGLNPPAAAAAAEGLATWTSMPLLDRTVLHQEELRQAAEKLAAKPKAAK